ncbi:MAG: TetR/AcrR family transcriptional regulator [Myxococcota bacterium]|nr:TetR/AcrR family transcriptional regulator [Myxococcota bacterium]
MTNSNKTSRSNKHNRIIDAAVDVIAEKGYHLSRISDIAKRAQVADGTIYLYFKSKEAILLAIFEEKMGLLISEVNAALLEESDPCSRLKEFIRQHFIHVEAYPALARVLQVELRQSRQFIREYRPEKLWDYLRIVGDIIQQGQQEGVFRADLDPFILQWSLFGTLDELSVQWILSKKRERFNLEQVVHQVSAVFLSGLVKP